MQSGRVAIYDTQDWQPEIYIDVASPLPGAKIVIDPGRNLLVIMHIDGLAQAWDYKKKTLLREFHLPVAVAGDIALDPKTGLILVAGTGCGDDATG